MASVTVAIPLHASKRWVGNVEATVRALPACVNEVLISDRTCVDNAATDLAERLADDCRVRVVREPAGLHWVDHCQLLIDSASGDLVTLMPHDDLFDAAWVTVLSQALERHPEALLAYGRMDPVEEDGVTPVVGWLGPMPVPGPISGRAALREFQRGHLGVAFRGLLRRRAVAGAGIRLRHPDWYPAPGGYHLVDQAWVLAMAMNGGIVFDDGTWTRKRIHPGSFIANHPGPGPKDPNRAALAVLRRHGPTRVRGRALRAGLRLGLC